MSDNKPLVSVIIACYNAENYINQCMDMLINQTYSNIEIIVCDDASSDSSLELLSQWAIKDSRVKVLHNDKNLFAAATRNRCFEIAKGDFFCIQDADDISKPERIERLLKEILSEKVDFVSSAMACFEGDVDNIVSYRVSKVMYPQKKDFLNGISFCHPATLFTRECIDSIKGYRVSPETKRCQDYDMFMRLYAAGFKGKNITEPLYLYRIERDTLNRGRSFVSTICEYKVRKNGFKLLKISFFQSFIYSLKPWVGYVFHKVISIFK